ncbi:MAG: type II toxin-antitoxin system HicA family toxin [Acutalibacteraceae bacterium]
MPMTSKQMEKLLLQNGFVFQRQKGSHRVYYNPQSKRTVIVPMHGTDLKKGTEQQILKDAGLK